MEKLLILLSVILAVLVIALALRNRFYKKQVKSFAKQAKERFDPDMNRPVRVETFSEEFLALADVLNELTELQKKTKQQADSDRQDLRMIIAGISHDFRTPLTASLGYLQMIERNAVLDEENLGYLRTAIRKNQYLKQLSDEFFEYSLLDTQQNVQQPKTIALKALLENITLGQYNMITSRGLEFSAELPDEEIYVSAREQDLARIIENLYSNAAKYACHKLHLLCSADSMHVTVSMKNDLSPESSIDTKHIFDPFFRNHNGSLAGNGLGLYVAKRLTEKYGGTLSADLTPDGFYQITFSLSLA